MKVSIIYGWTEGHWHGKKLRTALSKAGYSIVPDPTKADYIIAHSGGCFLIPENVKAKKILLVGLPYWPGKKITQSTKTKIKMEVKDIMWLKKTFFSAVYLFIKPRYWYRMYKSWKGSDLPMHEAASILLIRNKDEAFMHAEETPKLAEKMGWDFAEISGQHDDLWVNPQPYVEMLSR